MTFGLLVAILGLIMFVWSDMQKGISAVGKSTVVLGEEVKGLRSEVTAATNLIRLEREVAIGQLRLELERLPRFNEKDFRLLEQRIQELLDALPAEP